MSINHHGNRGGHASARHIDLIHTGVPKPCLVISPPSPMLQDFHEILQNFHHFYCPPSEGWGKVIVSVCSHFGGGGYLIQPWMGGGSQVSDFGGGPQVSDFRGGWGWGGLGGSQVSDFWRGGVVPVSVKGKIFDTRFGLIHVQTGKKNFCGGTPPLVKGNFFDTRFGLIHVQTGKKFFLLRDPPPPSKGKIF